MASDVLARVAAFATKADELCEKGHIMRAAENFGRAAEAASALGADNLVEVFMKLRQSNMLGAHAANTPDAAAATAARVQRIALLSGAVEALERRRAADTLMEGKCTAVEEVWFTTLLQETHRARRSAFAALLGYSTFLHAASESPYVLANADVFSTVCSNMQFQSFAYCVVHAAELMEQPRCHDALHLTI